MKTYTPDEVELSNGDILESPEEDSGAIRRIDCYGNTEEVRLPDDEDYGEWLAFFNKTPQQFSTEKERLEYFDKIDPFEVFTEPADVTIKLSKKSED